MEIACDLTEKNCKPCSGEGVALPLVEVEAYMNSLHGDWVLGKEGKQISREMKFKGFAKAVYFANMAAFIADKERHHPDIQFGWGYCKIIFTTHELGGLSENDFICAAKLDVAAAL
jgi:4a-hydroxytetrahydrobiopterin dehydratase